MKKKRVPLEELKESNNQNNLDCDKTLYSPRKKKKLESKKFDWIGEEHVPGAFASQVEKECNSYFVYKG